MQKKSIKKFKINALDVVIILLVLVCLVSIVLRAVEVNKWNESKELKEYSLYYKIDDIRSSTCSFLKDGDVVRIKSNNKVFGILEGDFERGLSVGAYNENGEEVFYPDSEVDSVYDAGRCSLSGYITVSGKMTDNGFLLNGDTYIAPNNSIVVVTERVETTINIISISEK